MDRFGPYTVLARLGAGGMATVDHATIDIGGGVIRDVALKRLLPQFVDDKRFIEDFIREAKLSAQLRHPNIVKILELGQIGSTYFIAMELVKGQSLMQLMHKAHVGKRPAPIGVVLAIISELCDALEYATNGTDLLGEKFRIIHRDLTPSNLIVTEDGHLKVIDFGVAKATAGKFMTNTGLVKGKLGYMAFEAVSGGVLDARSDIFSAGVVAWELLCGRRLWKGINEYEVICKIRDGLADAPSTINERCPTELDDAVLRALARSRDDRWPTAQQFRRALDDVRRYYRDGSSARDVAAWAGELAYVRTTKDLAVRHATEDEPTQPRAPLAAGERPDRLPEGSSRDSISGQAAQLAKAPKFVVADTLIDSETPRRERSDTQPEPLPLDDDVS
jgi:serine/threonine protein kinase